MTLKKVCWRLYEMIQMPDRIRSRGRDSQNSNFEMTNGWGHSKAGRQPLVQKNAL